ncbi:hypothetical protein WB91_16810 [bacteria symbiont BFo1 of Frankliniella occidentalis]|nr:hypothetical protein WB91_16810 [bacteria symbiont BFo1 of Frankliniella occidentalis]
MNSALNLLVVDGKKIINTASVPAGEKSQPVHIKAIDGAKYLLSSGDNQAAPEHMVVKRVGQDLQIFTADGDTTPTVIVDGFYQHQGELSGMAADGTYHTYVNQDGSDRDAFLLLNDNGTSTLILGDATSGLEGLAVDSGLSNAVISVGALAALAALAGVVMSRNNHHGDHNVTPAAPTGSEATDNVGTIQGKIVSGSVTDDTRPVLTGAAAPNSVIRIYDNGVLIGSTRAAENGSWQFQPAHALSEGSHSLTSSAAYGKFESAQSAPIGFTVDTTPPDAPHPGSLTDGNGKDLTTGGLTNNGNLNMSGRGVPGDVVKVWEGDTLIGSGVVGADGNWSVPVVIDGDREHDLSASFTDPAGNESAKSAPIAVDLDTTPPGIPDVGDLTDGNGQDLSTGGLTNNGELVMAGSGAVPGDTVKIWDGETLIGSGIVGPDGNWSVPVVVDGDGEHDLSASFTDPAGNEGAKSAPIAVDLDTTPPEAPTAGELSDGNGQDLSAGGLTNSGEMNMSGTGGVAGDTVNLYDGDTLIGTATVGADGNWSIPAEISGDRAHDLSTSYTDPAGNEGARSAPIVVDLDTTPPDAPTAGALTDGHSHDLSRGGLTNSGEMKGNESTRSAPVAVNLDTTPPDAPAAGTLNDGNGLNLSAGGLTNNGSLTMSGSGGTRGDIVKLYDGSTLIGSATVNADGSWTIPGAISGDHAHNLSTSYTDPAGNESTHSAPVTVNLDTTAPTTTLVLNDNTPSLSGHTEANALVMIYNGTELVGSQRANGSGDWSWRPTGTLADATYHFNATAQDSLGNVSRHTANLDFRVATTVNDFNDTTGQGWALEGPLAANASFTGSNVSFSATPGDVSGNLMYRTFTVEAGHTYSFSFRGLHWGPIGTPSTYLDVGLKVDGVSLGSPTWMGNSTARYTFTATHSGVVRLDLYTDDTVLDPNNRMTIDDFTIRDSAPTGATSVSSMGIESDDSVAQHHDDAISSLSAHHDVSSVAAQPEAAPVTTAEHNDGANPLQLSGNQLQLIDSSPVIDLTHVVAQHQGEEVHSVSLEGHGNNTLNVSINDVLALGSEDLFQQDGNKQLMIKGDAGDVVNLESINGDHAPEQWNAQGQVTHDGTTYNVYQNVDHEVEVLIQQGVQTHLQ